MRFCASVSGGMKPRSGSTGWPPPCIITSNAAAGLTTRMPTRTAHLLRYDQPCEIRAVKIRAIRLPKAKKTWRIPHA